MLKKIVILSLFLLISFQFSFSNSDNFHENLNHNLCRVSCTVSASDGFGNTVGVTASAGNIFTSCATAGEMACAKARRQLFLIMADQ